MTVYDVFNQISFFAAAFLITGVTLWNTLLQRRTGRLQNRVFLVVLVNVMICALTEILRISLLPGVRLHPFSGRIIMLCQGFYFLAHNMLAAMMGVYFMVVNGSFQRRGQGFRIFYLAPFVFMELIVITNPLFHFLYTYNDDYTVTRGPGGTLTYAISALYIIVAVVNLCMYWYTVPRARWKALLFFTGIVVVGVLIQFINPLIKSELVAESISFLGIMLAVENEDDRRDMLLGVYNRNALRDDLNSIFKLQQKAGVIGLRVVNYDILMRLLGHSGVDAVIRPVSDYLKTLFPWYRIYRVTPTDFVILLDHDQEEVIRLSEEIYVHFAEGVHVQNIDTPIRVLMLRAMIPEELHGQDDVLQMADGPIPEVEGHGILSGKHIACFARSTELENAISRGIVGKHFEVYYQPVHRLENMKLYGVKALARLHDKELGDLMPGEFIPLAERNGMIQQIGEMILEEVCDFIASGEPTKLGIHCVNVNLSFVQCMQPDFADRVIRLVDRYGVRSDMINFEITKPVNKTDFTVLDRVIRDLKKRGFLFSMEDYGSGYSNIDSIFTLDFDVVKIDKSILWSAAQSENGRIILSSSIRLVKELGRKILVEGVENVEQINVLEDFEVDYLQGYYFSQPVRRQELSSLVER